VIASRELFASRYAWGARSPLKKIRSRAPLRLGLAGGGTDVSPYSDDYGGMILNATIDRYAYAFIEPSEDGKVHFVATDLGVEEIFMPNPAEIATTKLKLHGAVYNRMVRDYSKGRPLAITLKTSVEAPAGSGLGSSSALVVAMVEAFSVALDVPLGPYDVAHLAFEIERIDLALSGGKQDQYAAAFGGVNFIEFMANDRVIVSPLRVSRSILSELESSLITCFSGISRSSEKIIELQRQGMTAKNAKTIDSLHQLKNDAIEMKQALLRADIPEMARILERSWRAKKETASGVSTTEIEKMYDIALSEGALAGKVSGAGGGGFIMFITPPERRLEITKKLNDAGGHAGGVKLTMNGVESWIA
jgi:D-glycero-alpha-D-manno-heptose-7-phosphate kinase